MWFDAPASSCGPHFDGHHFCAESFGVAGCACAAAIGASAYLPCAAPARAPPAPTAPAVLRKVRRSGETAELSDVSVGSVIAVPPSDVFLAALCFFFGTLMENYPTAPVECPGDEQSDSRSGSAGSTCRRPHQ